ncbi:MAG: hypothetical protein EOP84_19810 [Verrucomicrobiaceae bacterium]|nr:MAG: hypothetical protein EOP84_19810 [Verrucomicrobiaceae bacterium]
MKSKNENRWPHFRSKPERTCSEVELPSLAREIAESLQSGDRLILEGNLGAGKSTLVRHILQALDPKIESQAAPRSLSSGVTNSGGQAGSSDLIMWICIV